jgi:hypothetical protein
LKSIKIDIDNGNNDFATPEEDQQRRLTKKQRNKNQTSGIKRQSSLVYKKKQNCHPTCVCGTLIPI